MKIDPQLSLSAVHERLGLAAASDHEAQVMREVLLETYPERDFASLSEAEWLRAYGEMNRRKSTGWLDGIGPTG